ncbi:flavin-containing monooxygenase [Duganella hordei]|uniref:flavin-containing monooxygenase n=1 Tax=Duganella hordei TaxID=2865934 RepID=UPI0030E92B4D
MDSDQSDHGADVEVAIVGSGYAGLCMGIKLRERGIADFVILEQNAEFGGTWRVNSYPGAACDIPSHLYSFSFAQNADWSRKFPRQPELLAYAEDIVRRYGLAPHLRLGHGLLAADYDEARGRWRLRTARGELSARNLMLATGGLSRAALPALPGLDSFAGKVFHSARWDHGYDLRGKRVAVIGTGASAIQFVPEIAPLVAQLDLYQRTAPWVLPRPDRAITAAERWLLRRLPPLRKLYRLLTYVQYESRYLVFAGPSWLAGVAARLGRRHLRRQLPHDAALRARLAPSYRPGCKRMLLSNDYYPALARANVGLHTCGIAAVRPRGIAGADGVERAVDAIIFATGFDVEHALGAVAVRGRGGALLADAARGGLAAYKGATVPGFPNMYMIAGPNTGLGHNSMIYMIESGVRYAVEAVLARRRAGWRALEVRDDVCRQYNQRLQARFKGTAWASGCRSWYLASGGRNSALWPGFTFEYRRITRRFDAPAYLATSAHLEEGHRAL